MKILVTGGGGFLGSYIVRELLKNPTFIITNFSRHSYPELEDLGVPTIKGDLCQRADVERALDFGFDAIIHVAAKAGVWGRYQEFYDINFLGTKHLVELAKLKGVTRFVYTSTPSVVFNETDLLGVDETTPYATTFLTPYAQTKAMAEKFVLSQNDSSSFLTCAIRPHLIWGPGDPHLFPRIIQKAKASRLRKIGDGENLVDIAYVENVATAHVQALNHLHSLSPVAGEAYFIGQERPVNLWNFIDQILSHAKLPPVDKYMASSMAYKMGYVLEILFKFLGIYKPEPPMTRFVAQNLSKSHYFSHAKAHRHFGYRPVISIEEGLKRTFDHKIKF
jgi:2-alkyl-3-oxoalkanoate reductase